MGSGQQMIYSSMNIRFLKFQSPSTLWWGLIGVIAMAAAYRILPGMNEEGVKGIVRMLPRMEYMLSLSLLGVIVVILTDRFSKCRYLWTRIGYTIIVTTFLVSWIANTFITWVGRDTTDHGPWEGSLLYIFITYCLILPLIGASPAVSIKLGRRVYFLSLIPIAWLISILLHVEIVLAGKVGSDSVSTGMAVLLIWGLWWRVYALKKLAVEESMITNPRQLAWTAGILYLVALVMLGLMVYAVSRQSAQWVHVREQWWYEIIESYALATMYPALLAGILLQCSRIRVLARIIIGVSITMIPMGISTIVTFTLITWSQAFEYSVLFPIQLVTPWLFMKYSYWIPAIGILVGILYPYLQCIAAQLKRPEEVQRRIQPHYRSNRWMLRWLLILITLALLIAPSWGHVKSSIDVIVSPQLYPDIFPQVIPMVIVGLLLLAITLLTTHPSKKDYWIARTCLIASATIMSTFAFFSVYGRIYYVLDKVGVRACLLLFILSLWLLVLAVNPNMPVMIEKWLGYISKWGMILVVLLMLAGWGPYLVLFMLIYYWSYCRIRDVKNEAFRNIPIASAARYFSWITIKVFGMALLMIIVWGYLIRANYPVSMELMRNQFTNKVLIPIWCVPAGMIGISLFVLSLCRYRRLYGMCIGFSLSAIPVGFILMLHFMWAVLSWYEYPSLELIQWARNPIRFITQPHYLNFPLIEILIVSIAIPLMGATFGIVIQWSIKQYRNTSSKISRTP
jgi:hypothetical protein